MANDNKPDATGTHIWLRHTTQFTIGKRTHTVEVGIPVPIGASAETRERLIREAEASMEQFASHVERRVEQRQQGQTTQPAASPARQMPAVEGRPAAAAAATSKPPAPANKPADVSPAPVAAAKQREVAVPPTRPNIGASMPAAPGSDMGGSMNKVQFIQYVNRELGIDPRRAMQLLNVKSLEGLNYRDAVEELQQIVMSDPALTASLPAVQPERETGAPRPAQSEAKPASASANTRSTPARDAMKSAPASLPDIPPTPEPAAEPAVPPGVVEIKDAVVRDMRAPYFDEEEDLSLDDEGDYLADLSEEERARAEEILDRLREARGSAQASEKRLATLRTVVNDQVSEDRLEELVEGVWGATSLKKLKDEQLEELISWAKRADDFIAEVDMVLALLQEESYARSDR